MYGDDEKSCASARRINESTAKLCAEHPEKFAFAAVLSLPCVDGAVKETAYAMDILGALVIIHPCRARQCPENVITGRVAALYEYPADTTRAALNMIAHRVMMRFPNIRFVVLHTGSFLPYNHV